MSLNIKNWPLLLLALLLIVLFTRLGFWQLSRAQQKEKVLAQFSEREEQVPLSADALNSHADLRFYRATLKGKFDNSHTFLLDNKIQDGRVGYEVYTPFFIENVATPILIDRGFIPLTTPRNILPTIAPIDGTIQVSGFLNLPPTYVAFGKIIENNSPSWPLRIEFVHLKTLSDMLQVELFPYVLTLEANHPAAFAIKWQIVTINPERHRGYALQWFAFALTLVVLSLALNWRSAKR